jgi:hypothetical protein
MSYKNSSLVILAVSFFFLFVSGCPEVCTEIGCGDDFELKIFHVDGGDLSEGSFDISIDIGGGVVENLTCVTGDQEGCHTFSDIFHGYMDAANIYVMYYGYDGDPPDSFEVTVVLDGEDLGSQEYDPSWTVDYPNGEDCPPACWNAPDEDLEIDRPVLDG